MAVGILEDLACVIKNEHRLLPFILRQFPRPRLLRVLLDIRFGAKQDLDPGESGDPFFVSSLRSAWALVDGLGRMFGRDRYCSRRNCMNRAIRECKACRTVRYCDRACQKMYVITNLFVRVTEPD